MTKARPRWFALLSSTLALYACAQNTLTESHQSDDAPIIGIKDDPSGVVGVLHARRARVAGDSNFPADKRPFNGTAAVYTRKCVITATHVVNPPGDDRDLSDTISFFHGSQSEYDADKRFQPKEGATVVKGKKIVHQFSKITKIVEAAEYPEIVIVALDGELPEPKKGEVDIFAPFSIGTKAPAEGDSLTVAGYGLGSFADDKVKTSVHGSATFDVKLTPASTKGMSFVIGDPAVTVANQKLPSLGVAPGDSGGPITAEGRVLVGIESTGFPMFSNGQVVEPDKTNYPELTKKGFKSVAGFGTASSVVGAFASLSKDDKKKIDDACAPSTSSSSSTSSSGFGGSISAGATSSSSSSSGFGGAPATSSGFGGSISVGATSSSSSSSGFGGAPATSTSSGFGGVPATSTSSGFGGSVKTSSSGGFGGGASSGGTSGAGGGGGPIATCDPSLPESCETSFLDDDFALACVCAVAQ